MLRSVHGQAAKPWWADLSAEAKGAIAEARVRQRAAELGIVLAEVVGNKRYDVIVDDGHLHRCQIKWASRGQTPGTVIANLRTWDRSGRSKKGRTYDATEIDALIVFVPQFDQLLWVPAELVAGKAALQVRIEPTRNGQTRGVVWAHDFIW